MFRMLESMYTYVASSIPTFVMYYVYGVPDSALLIESMICGHAYQTNAICNDNVGNSIIYQ